MSSSLIPRSTVVRPRAETSREPIAGLEFHLPPESATLLYLGSVPGWEHCACVGTSDGRLYDCFGLDELEPVPPEQMGPGHEALIAHWAHLLSGPSIRPKLTRLFRRDPAADARWPFSHWSGATVHYLGEGAEHGLVVVADHTGVQQLAIPADLRVPLDDPAAADAGSPTVAEIDFPPFTVVQPNPDSSTWRWRTDTPEGREAVKRHPLPVTMGDQVLWACSLADETGHCAVMTLDGQVVWALHPNEFIVVPEREVSSDAAALAASWRSTVRDGVVPRGSIVVFPDLPRHAFSEHRLYLGQLVSGDGTSVALVATAAGTLERLSSLNGYHLVRELFDDDIAEDGTPVEHPRAVITADGVLA